MIRQMRSNPRRAPLLRVAVQRVESRCRAAA